MIQFNLNKLFLFVFYVALSMFLFQWSVGFGQENWTMLLNGFNWSVEESKYSIIFIIGAMFGLLVRIVLLITIWHGFVRLFK